MNIEKIKEFLKSKEGVNVVRSCKCGNYYGDEGGKVTIEKDRSY